MITADEMKVRLLAQHREASGSLYGALEIEGKVMFEDMAKMQEWDEEATKRKIAAWREGKAGAILRCYSIEVVHVSQLAQRAFQRSSEAARLSPPAESPPMERIAAAVERIAEVVCRPPVVFSTDGMSHEEVEKLHETLREGHQGPVYVRS